MTTDYEKIDQVYCEFLNISFDDIICKLDTDDIIKLRKAVEEDNFDVIHRIGYKLF